MTLRRVLAVFGLALVGLLAAASIGYASYLVSRDSVGLPVTKLEGPADVTPRAGRRARPRAVPTRTATVEDRRGQATVEDRRGQTTVEDRGREPGDDNSGRGSSGSGSGGGDSSGSGSGGSGSGRSGGGDDD